MSRPPLTVLLGPAHSGKSRTCIEHLIAEDSGAWLLTPGDSEAEQVRRRAKNATAPVRQRICSLTSFAAKVAGHEADGRDIISPPMQRAALNDLLERQGGYFVAMRDTPGFVDALAESIREMKQSAVRPADLENAIEGTNGAEHPFTDKARSLARLFRGYSEFLTRNDLRDQEDLYSLAAVRARGAGFADARVVLIDGFYRIAPLWYGLLGSLAARGVRVTITLDYDPDRPVLFATTHRTLEALRREFDVHDEQLTKQPDASQLSRVESRIFSGISKRIEEPGDGSITLIDAPNVYSEVELVARALCRENEVNGTPWDQCTVFLRSYGDYSSIIRSVFERFGIPVCIPERMPVLKSPAVRALNALARIAAHDWQREDVVRFLKSPAVNVDNLSVDILVRQMSKHGTASGRQAWSAVETDAQLSSVLRCLRNWEDDLHAVGQDCAVVLETVASESGLLELNESTVKAAIGVVHSTARAARIVERPYGSFADFWTHAEAALESAVMPPRRKPDSVWVLEAYDTGQRRCIFAAVLGLIERGFPVRINENPFFRDDERAVLRAAGLKIENSRDRADDERLLFYRCITEPSERLVLSYPRSSDESDTLRSFYLEEVLAAAPVTEVFKELSDVAPTPEECVNPHDELLSACASLVDSAGEGPAIGWSQRLLAAAANDDILRRVAETTALPSLPRLTDAGTRAELSRRRRYNVSELETYNACPFQHLLKHVLHVRPDEEMAWLAQRGTHYHEALTRQFRSSTAEMPAGELRDALLAQAEKILDESEVEMPLHRRRLLERFLRQALSEFAIREEAYRRKFELRPAHFELAFGMPAGDQREYDPASRAEPLVIEADDGSEIQLCGAMDRVDRGPHEIAMVMDYKTGVTPTFEQLKEGRSIQLPVYLMALEQIFGLNPVAACFDSSREPFRRRFFRSEQLKRFGLVEGLDQGPNVKPISPDEQAELYDVATGRIIQAVKGIRSANVLPIPGEHCRFCDYRDCCRTSRDYQHDGEPFDLLKDSGDESEVG